MPDPFPLPLQFLFIIHLQQKNNNSKLSDFPDTPYKKQHCFIMEVFFLKADYIALVMKWWLLLIR